jgi:hypothetical protein
MKLITKLALLVPLLTACSATMSNETTTLQPLPTTINIPVIDTIPSTDVQFTSEQTAFVDDVYFFYGGVPSIADEELVEIGELWCQLMTDGMSAKDVIGRINEGSSDNADALLHFSIVNAGIENLCPSQWDKAEYIALNTPYWATP